MRVMALQPPPPQPITLIMAGLDTKVDFAIFPPLLSWSYSLVLLTE
jgi:hypothetical protein